MITIEGIRATGLCLLDVLHVEKTVRYSRFYNADPETENRLAAAAMPFVLDKEGCRAGDFREEAM